MTLRNACHAAPAAARTSLGLPARGVRLPVDVGDLLQHTLRYREGEVVLVPDHAEDGPDVVGARQAVGHEARDAGDGWQLRRGTHPVDVRRQVDRPLLRLEQQRHAVLPGSEVANAEPVHHLLVHPRRRDPEQKALVGAVLVDGQEADLPAEASSMAARLRLPVSLGMCGSYAVIVGRRGSSASMSGGRTGPAPRGAGNQASSLLRAAPPNSRASDLPSQQTTQPTAATAAVPSVKRSPSSMAATGIRNSQAKRP